MILAIFFLLSFPELYRVMLAKWDDVTIWKTWFSVQLVPPVIKFMAHSSERMGGARGRERGGGVMFTATWRELALRERGMISSWADSWEHNGRLPAAAWQIEREGKSDTERLLQTASAPSSLLIISNWASGSNLGREGRQCACALSQWNAEWSFWYIFRCFEKGW